MPDPLNRSPTVLDGHLVDLVATATAALSAAVRGAGDVHLDSFASLALHIEAAASSVIEGVQASAKSVALADFTGHGPLGAQGVARNARIMRLATRGLAQAQTVSLDDVEQLQAQLVPHLPGLRQEQVWIGGANPMVAQFVPPKHERVRPLMDDLLAYLNDPVDTTLVAAATIHAQFETIHPFRDGNGRIGRALTRTVLARSHRAPTVIPFSRVFAARKRSYIEGLTAWRTYDGTDGRSNWISAFAEAIIEAAALTQHRGLQHRPRLPDLSRVKEKIGRERPTPAKPTAVAPLVASTADGLMPSAAGFAIYYAALVFLHHFVLTGRIRTIMETSAALSAAVLAVTVWYLHRAPPPQHPSRWAVWLAFIVVANTLLHLELTGDLMQSSNIMIIIMGAGALVHSRRYATSVIGLTLLGWVLVVLRAPPDPAWMHFAIGICTATGVAAILHITRARTVLRLTAAEAAVRRLALTDDLTGLLNRRGLMTIGQPLIQAARRSNAPVSVLFLDVDGLKQVNDHEGHAAGDRLIRSVSATLSDTLPGADAMGRLGGDEFAVILIGTSPFELNPLVERLSAGFAAADISVSTGTAHLDEGLTVDTLEDLLNRADADMYQMKQSRSSRP